LGSTRSIQSLYHQHSAMLEGKYGDKTIFLEYYKSEYAHLSLPDNVKVQLPQTITLTGKNNTNLCLQLLIEDFAIGAVPFTIRRQFVNELDCFGFVKAIVKSSECVFVNPLNIDLPDINIDDKQVVVFLEIYQDLFRKTERVTTKEKRLNRIDLLDRNKVKYYEGRPLSLEYVMNFLPYLHEKYEKAIRVIQYGNNVKRPFSCKHHLIPKRLLDRTRSKFGIEINCPYLDSLTLVLTDSQHLLYNAIFNDDQYIDTLIRLYISKNIYFMYEILKFQLFFIYIDGAWINMISKHHTHSLYFYQLKEICSVYPMTKTQLLVLEMKMRTWRSKPIIVQSHLVEIGAKYDHIL